MGLYLSHFCLKVTLTLMTLKCYPGFKNSGAIFRIGHQYWISRYLTLGTPVDQLLEGAVAL